MQFDKPGRIFEAEQIAATLQKVGDEIIAEFREKTEDLLLLGIQRRGVPLANRLSRYIKEIAHTADEDTPDLEYTWATMDKRLAQIYGEHFVPAKERYGR